MELTTPRLFGCRPTADDLGLYRLLLNDPAVAVTMGGPRTDQQLTEALHRHLASWERHGVGPCLLFDRETGDFVGRGGLNHVHVLGHDEVEVGYALLPEHWGRGLATEVARTAVQLGLQSHESIVGFTLPSNVASQRVLTKCGMVYERNFVHYGLDHVFLRVTRAAGPVG